MCDFPVTTTELSTYDRDNWLTKPKIFTIGHVRQKFADLCPRTR